MNIYIIEDDDSIPVLPDQLASQLSNSCNGTHTISCSILPSNQLDTLVLEENDIIFMAGSVVQSQDSVKKVVQKCFENRAHTVLVTELPIFRTDTPDVAYPGIDDLRVFNIARELRLRVLDLFAYAVSWYMHEPETVRAGMLAPVEGGRVFSDDALNMITSFIARWIVRRFCPHKHVDEKLYGASMYPEVWDDETNAHDMRQARDIGLNVVRIGEFFWSKLEPEEGQYDMAYLENLLEQYRHCGLKVILGVPTPTPPRWFTKHYPNACIVSPDGVQQHHGSRQHVCTNNPDFRRKAYQLARHIGETASRYPNVVAIQLDNEFKCHVDLCVCGTCKRMWPRWLQAQYGDIENLNSQWGTNIWSESYESFDDVVLPEPTPFAHNSSLDYAFRTFTADTLSQFASGLAQVLIDTTSIPLTHNTSTNFNLRNYDVFNQLDIVGFDTYPNSLTPWMFPMNLALWRNIIDNDNVLLLETCSSHVGYTQNYMLPHPAAYLQTEVFLGYAAGLKSFMYWLYREQKYGVEQPHGALFTAAGTPDIGYPDVIDSWKIIKQCMPQLLETQVARSSVAMVYSDEARRAFNVENGGIYNYKTMVTDFYHALSARGVNPELIPENADFDGYRCVIVPFVRHVSDTLMDKMHQFVAHGGKLVLGPMTGDRTADMAWNTDDGNGLGKLGQWMGIRDTVQYLSSDSRTEAVVHAGEAKEALKGLVTMFRADSCPEYMTVSSPIGDGRTALARRDGATYIGGIPADSDTSPFWDALVSHEIAPFDDDIQYLSTGGWVLRFKRQNDRHIDYYIANMGAKPTTIDLHRTASDSSGKPVDAGIRTMQPFECLLLRFDR